MKCPCTLDCPDRNATCHRDCMKPEYREWVAFVKGKHEESEKRYRINEYVDSRCQALERRRRWSKKY